MRVIAGTLRGRVLPANVEQGVRPTLDATRQSLFNVLDHRLSWQGTRVCDLCAGTGALGIEALSRGAATCTFIEQQRRVAKGIEQNVVALGIREQSRIIIADALEYVTRYDVEKEAAYDVVFIDAPYALRMENAVIAMMAERGMLKQGGHCIAEHDRFEVVMAPKGWELSTTRNYGDTVVDVLQRIG